MKIMETNIQEKELSENQTTQKRIDFDKYDGVHPTIWRFISVENSFTKKCDFHRPCFCVACEA